MNNVREYHQEATRYAQLALAASHAGKQEDHQQLMHRAMILETKAADLTPDEKSAEPTRSILYRSAASFAYQAGEYQEAERLVFNGLSGYPSALVKEQLIEVQQLSKEAASHQQTTGTKRNAIAQQVVTAIYENGALHPTVALPLKEHQKVEIWILPALDEIPVS